jgi:predicted glycosyltransferase involved in capsule biosynthesis
MLAIIVPYRDRSEHLRIFRRDIDMYMKEKNMEYSLYIVEQEEGSPFNRGKLMNIGFDLCKDKCEYICFHDVDMIPVEADYSKVDIPTHIASSVEQFGWSLPYEGYFGGVTLFDKQSFTRINGYSNEYWGWGVEDDDLLLRCKKAGVETLRRPCSFRSLHHERKVDPKQYENNFKNFKEFRESQKDLEEESGLGNLTYQILSTVSDRGDIVRVHVKVSI